VKELSKFKFLNLLYFNRSFIFTFFSAINVRWSVNYKPKHFFEQFAQRYGFDPLVAKNWYHFSEEQIKDFEVCSKQEGARKRGGGKRG
jgi:hypothetical protein